MLQNMYVVQDGATYTALTDLTREVLHSSPSAGVAVQSAIDALAGNGRANLYLDTLRAGQYGNFVPNLVTNCLIYGGGKGIECHRAIALNIVACAVHQTHGAAYHIHSRSHSVAISGARSYQISGDAVLVEDSHEFSLSGSVLCWHTGHGVAARDACWGTIAGNSVNFYADAAVRSAGQQSIARDNSAHAERPCNDMPTAINAQRKVQSFEQALIERFIALQSQRDEL